MIKKSLITMTVVFGLIGVPGFAAELANGAAAGNQNMPTPYAGMTAPMNSANAGMFNPMAMMPMMQGHPNVHAMNLARPDGWSVFMNPGTYPAMMNPATYGQFMNPQFYMQFANPNNMMAWMNPNAYSAFMNPATYSMMMNPMAYMQFMSPNTYMQWMNPGNYNTYMNPNTYMQWMNPAGYTMAPQGVPGNFNWFDPNASSNINPAPEQQAQQ